MLFRQKAAHCQITVDEHNCTIFVAFYFGIEVIILQSVLSVSHGKKQDGQLSH